jgi:hypothetical protein
MNGRFQMQGGKNWFLPKEMNANRFFWDSHWLEIWSNHFYPSMGPNGGSVAMDSEDNKNEKNVFWRMFTEIEKNDSFKCRFYFATNFGCCGGLPRSLLRLH